MAQLLHLKYTKPQVHPERMLQCCVPSTPLLTTKVAGACRGSPSSLQVFDTLLFQSSFDAVSLPFPINVAFSSRKLHKYIRRGSNVLIQGCRDVFYRLQKSEFERSRGLQVRLQTTKIRIILRVCFSRLETTNCSVLDFSALLAAIVIKKYIEIQ